MNKLIFFELLGNNTFLTQYELQLNVEFEPWLAKAFKSEKKLFFLRRLKTQPR